MTITKTAGKTLPADALQWGHDITAEVINRLPKIQPFILEARIVYHNSDGNGLVLVILQGSKAFIPVVVKEWEMQPVDVIVFKRAKEMRYAYLSERTLLSMLTSSSLGDPITPGAGGVGPGGVKLNLLAPSLGGRVPMPFAQRKSASLAESISVNFPAFDLSAFSPAKNRYAAEYFRNNSTYWQKSAHLQETIAPEEKIPQSDIAVMVKFADESLRFYSENYPEGTGLTDAQAAEVFSRVISPTERQEKAASFMGNRISLMGTTSTRPSNIMLQYTPDYIDTDLPEPVLPSSEGVFMSRGRTTYINPKMVYLSGIPFSYALAVQLGAYNLTRDLRGFHLLNTPESSNLSREDLLPAVPVENLVPGMIVTLYDKNDRTVTIPCEVSGITKASSGILVRMKPLYGDIRPVDVLFGRTARRKYIEGAEDILAVPYNDTKVFELPAKVESFSFQTDSPSPYQEVVISKGGGETYSLTENGTFIDRLFNFGDMAYRLIKRYGASDAQAAKILKSLSVEKRKRFLVRFFLDEVLPEPLPGGDVNQLEKELIHKMASIAEGIDRMRTVETGTVKSGMEMDRILDYYLDKYAAEEPQGQGPAPETIKPNQAMPAPQPVQGPNIVDYLMKMTPVAKDTQEVIDLLTYYAMGKFRSDEAVELIGKLEASLRDVENHLSKILLLTLMDRVPGHDYSDAKVLLSDLDSYLSVVLSSRVILKGLK